MQRKKFGLVCASLLRFNVTPILHRGMCKFLSNILYHFIMCNMLLIFFHKFSSQLMSHNIFGRIFQISRCGTGFLSGCVCPRVQQMRQTCCPRFIHTGVGVGGLIAFPWLDYESSSGLIEMQYCNIETHADLFSSDICASTARSSLWRFGEVTLPWAPSAPAGDIDRFHQQRHM